MLRPVLHLLLHALLPFAIARYFTSASWKQNFVIMMATMLVDLDHLLVTPVYDPNRCSIGYHPLHSWDFVIVYTLMVGIRPLCWIGIGLTLHMLLDAFDCFLMGGFG